MAYAINLHAWGSSWHSWHGDPDQIVPLLEISNLLSWHVTFNKLSINHGCVAGRQPWRYAQLLFHCAHVRLNMVGHFETIGFQVRDPLLAATTVRISVDVDGQWLGGVGRRGHQQPSDSG
jgi:hypothetical protein